MRKEKGSGRALGLDPFFRDGLCFFIIIIIIIIIIILFFYLFLLPFYFRILILYTTDFNQRINKDVIIIFCYFQPWPLPVDLRSTNPL